MKRGWTSQGALTSFRHRREFAAAAVFGSGEVTVLSLIRSSEGLNLRLQISIISVIKYSTDY